MSPKSVGCMLLQHWQRVDTECTDCSNLTVYASSTYRLRCLGLHCIRASTDCALLQLLQPHCNALAI